MRSRRIFWGIKYHIFFWKQRTGSGLAYMRWDLSGWSQRPDTTRLHLSRLIGFSLGQAPLILISHSSHACWGQPRSLFSRKYHSIRHALGLWWACWIVLTWIFSFTFNRIWEHCGISISGTLFYSIPQNAVLRSVIVTNSLAWVWACPWWEDNILAATLVVVVGCIWIAEQHVQYSRRWLRKRLG